MLDVLRDPLTWWSVLLFLVAAAGAGWALGHAVLTKRDVRAAIGWSGLVLVFPVVGPILYAVFGINRIGRRAVALRGPGDGSGPPPSTTPPGGEDLEQLAHLVERVVGAPLVDHNSVEPLVDGDEAYPAMLEAIGSARRTLSFSTYIFDHDETGKRFRDALAEAVERGVQVRVIIDGAGARYSWRPMHRSLARHGVPVKLFLPTLIPWWMPYMNLRTHRKILVADGHTAFLGGINIRHGHLVQSGTRHPVQDVHFRVRGPVVEQVQRLFAEDWKFVAGENLEGDGWFPRLEPTGEVDARVIPDGPDHDIDKLRWTLFGALAVARESVHIATPYFLPDTDLITALNVTALRGVKVEVLLPRVNNLTLVQWASTAHLPHVLEHGCRVWMTPPPFDHSKLLIVDGKWALVGSANWDPRSLRLNFEIGLEMYDEPAVAKLEEIFRRKKRGAREITAEELEGRPLLERLRDGVARLAQPYL